MTTNNTAGSAPFGVHPVLGIPYSEKSKDIAGLLQILVPVGLGRFYTGHMKLAIAQLLVTLCTLGLGSVWCLVDAIRIFMGRCTDVNGNLLR